MNGETEIIVYGSSEEKVEGAKNKVLEALGYTSNTAQSNNGDDDDDFIDWEKIKGDFDAAQQAKWEKCSPLKKDFYQEHPGRFISISVSFLFGHNEVLTCSSAKAMSIPNKPSCCCNSIMIHSACPRWFTLHHNFPTNKPLVGYAVRNNSFELGPPSGTGKLISPLLDASTFHCTRISNK